MAKIIMNGKEYLINTEGEVNIKIKENKLFIDGKLIED